LRAEDTLHRDLGMVIVVVVVLDGFLKKERTAAIDPNMMMTLFLDR